MTVDVPLRSRKRQRALAAQKLQHAIPAIPLLVAGVHALGEHAEGAALILALFEIATSALLLGSVVREVRRVRGGDSHAAHSSHGVDWFHIFAAAVMTAEVAEHYHLTHHWRRPTILLAIFTLGLGILHGRLERFSARRQSLRLDDDGIYVGGRPWGSFRASWPEIESIEIGPRYATIRARSGRERRIDLNDCQNAAEVRAAIATARNRLIPPHTPETANG